jgi:hypothetical protein
MDKNDQSLLKFPAHLHNIHFICTIHSIETMVASGSVYADPEKDEIYRYLRQGMRGDMTGIGSVLSDDRLFGIMIAILHERQSEFLNMPEFYRVDEIRLTDALVGLTYLKYARYIKRLTVEIQPGDRYVPLLMNIITHRMTRGEQMGERRIETMNVVYARDNVANINSDSVRAVDTPSRWLDSPIR